MTTKQEIKRLRAALQDIAEPMAELEAEAKRRGGRLNGYAMQLINDPRWLRDKARKALREDEPR